MLPTPSDTLLRWQQVAEALPSFAECNYWDLTSYLWLEAYKEKRWGTVIRGNEIGGAGPAHTRLYFVNLQPLNWQQAVAQLQAQGLSLPDSMRFVDLKVSPEGQCQDWRPSGLGYPGRTSTAFNPYAYHPYWDALLPLLQMPVIQYKGRNRQYWTRLLIP